MKWNENALKVFIICTHKDRELNKHINMYIHKCIYIMKYFTISTTFSFKFNQTFLWETCVCLQCNCNCNFTLFPMFCSIKNSYALTQINNIILEIQKLCYLNWMQSTLQVAKIRAQSKFAKILKMMKICQRIWNLHKK